MTREMNKPDWHSKWIESLLERGFEIETIGVWEQPKERVLDEDWLVFVKELNKNLGVND